MNFLIINVRGTVFKTKAKNLEKVPQDSPLANLNKTSEYFDSESGEFFFDRSAEVFDTILDYFTTGRLHIPTSVCAERVREELSYWKVPESHLSRCCWKNYYQKDEDMDVLTKLLHHVPCVENRITTSSADCCDSPNIIKPPETEQNFRSRTWACLNNRKKGILAKIWYVILCFSIIVSTAIFLLQSIPMFRVDAPNTLPFPYNITSKPLLMYWYTMPHPILMTSDGILNFIFMVDWFLRLYACPCKEDFMKGLLNILDLVAWVAIWNILWIEFYRDIFHFKGAFSVLFMIGTLYATRIFRVFRLMQHNCGVKILLLSLKSSARELCILAITFACVSVIFAFLLYMSEFNSTSHVKFPNALTAIWWAIVTMTTVGYGDFYPTTPQGYCIGALCSITGILLIALPVAVTSSNFSDFYNFNKYRAKYQEALTREGRELPDHNKTVMDIPTTGV
ncbi:potassium voltage-gated channel subfamily C member 3-like [Ylistrum balloti]|uniref:potassium voltage-gated channel subfamily C member 3-like n=1 Tax=Ylistrum balloti TaxID=509963 RepID=UPI0029059356|nr:potassium voltage-gated channel subfamily C member 3-like [Ylistrum balloti]